MKITFIGTSHGVPKASRYCTCFMIESGGAVYLVDAGAPIIDILNHSGKSPEDIRAVFTTHAHADHTAGIPFLANRMNWFMYQSRCVFFLTTNELIEAVKGMNRAWGDGEMSEKKTKFRLASEGVMFDDGNIRAEYIKTAHTDPSYAILITEGETRVLFGGDFSQGLEKNDIPQLIKEELDLFLCELGHFSFDELDPHLRECKAKRVLFTHVFPDNQLDDIKARNGSYPFPISAPDDGDSIEI